MWPDGRGGGAGPGVLRARCGRSRARGCCLSPNPVSGRDGVTTVAYRPNLSVGGMM